MRLRAHLSQHVGAVALSCALTFNPMCEESTCALEVSPRSTEDALRRQLYAPPPEVQSFQQQLSDAQPFKTMRGVWRLREYDQRGREVASGVLTFRGAGGDVAERGSVVYEGDAAPGRGPWILKADGFGRSQTGVGGIIEKKALWKLRRGAVGTFTYSGRINVPSFTGQRPDAVISGQIVQLVNGGKPKGGSEISVGRFEAELTRDLTMAEESAAVDSEAAGGAPEALRLACVESTAVVSGIPMNCR